jgi:hypothetical protein
MDNPLREVHTPAWGSDYSGSRRESSNAARRRDGKSTFLIAGLHNSAQSKYFHIDEKTG